MSCAKRSFRDSWPPVSLDRHRRLPLSRLHSCRTARRTTWTYRTMQLSFITSTSSCGSFNPDHLRFDPKHTHGIKRNMFFFRNYHDCSSVTKTAILTNADESGPLIDCGGYPIRFGPLLRVRAVIGHNVYQLSWTSYQPISLIWDYWFWGGRDEFRAKVKMQSSDSVPHLDFTSALPPHYLKAWKAFIHSQTIKHHHI